MYMDLNTLHSVHVKKELSLVSFLLMPDSVKRHSIVNKYIISGLCPFKSILCSLLTQTCDVL